MRLRDIEEEIEKIFEEFPELRSEDTAPERPRAAGRTGTRQSGGNQESVVAYTDDGVTLRQSGGKRKRRHMGAAQRKAASARMKKYWAERRKSAAK